MNRQELDYVRTQNDKVLAVIDGMNGDENESEDESSYDDSDTDATFHPPSAQTLADENTSNQKSSQAKASTSQKAKKSKASNLLQTQSGGGRVAKTKHIDAGAIMDENLAANFSETNGS